MKIHHIRHITGITAHCAQSPLFHVEQNRDLGEPLSFRPQSEENFTAMVAAIGTGGIPRPNRRLIGDAPRLSIKAVPAFGKTVALRWENPAGVLLARVSRTAEGVGIETDGTSVRVGLREWPMPLGRGSRERFVCRCGASRDVLHWRGEWGCRGKDCLDLTYACRH